MDWRPAGCMFFFVFFFLHSYYSANSTLLSLFRFSYFITPYDAQASSAFSALINFVSSICNRDQLCNIISSYLHVCSLITQNTLLPWTNYIKNHIKIIKFSFNKILNHQIQHLEMRVKHVLLLMVVNSWVL